VTKQEIQDILKYAKDQGEYDALNNLIQEETLKKTEKSNLNILDLLVQFPSISMTFIEFYNLCGKIAPRFYTVASSNKNTPGKLEIAISLIGHNTHLLNSKEESRYGLTSSYINNIKSNFDLYKDDKIKTKLIVRESGFKIPHNPHIGLIMICTGTGIAPFISFLREILASNTKRDCLLFFGSKNSAYDFIYEDEIREYLKNGTLNSLFTAFQEIAVIRNMFRIKY
jgi:sulfite reductase alpha subunit-like flavoprotein